MTQFEKMKNEIVDILFHADYNICFLIGDNSCGKTDIASMLRERTEDIIILDNFNGKYEDIPQDKKCLVITHSRQVLESAKYSDMVIAICPDYLFCVTDICDGSKVQNLISMTYEKPTTQSVLSRLLNNVLSCGWSEYFDEYYEKVKKENLSKSDEVIIKEIEKWKHDLKVNV